ncbi:alpha-L-rhamnosidase-related protein [Ructibacterium gallinarum]|uniref:Sugar hydrolase n=1 Tax=Ructibacterium gallinarum TaxID=2779355 RepID=A0A9D5M0H1_9FIRM|nr:sugar hydrolase [Ructibacterium gallinarum]MBE5039203.1 sugar hydrolase [Ructibacterium gallinarum]
MDTKEIFLTKAEVYKPSLCRKETAPIAMIAPFMGASDWEYKKICDAAELSSMVLGKGDKICLDFGDHQVGYLHFTITPKEGLPDAPAYIKLKFGERICEIAEKFSQSDVSAATSISSSWIQEESIHIDILPQRISLPRRYAFRFMEIEVLDTSPYYKITIDNVLCESVSAVDMDTIKPCGGIDSTLDKIDSISIKTMAECAQDVFEDGPKRDRRLWIGDLRLEALADYETFQNYDLVKRCMYLFAGTANEDGQVGSCLYVQPQPVADRIYLFDYTLLYVCCLYDYYMETKDMPFLKELWDTAYRQIEIALQRVDENGLLPDSKDWDCFIDWNPNLNKQASAQGVLIYTLKRAKELANILGDTARAEESDRLIRRLSDSALQFLWDETSGFFRSGDQRQISWASQIWLVLAEILDPQQNAALLKRLMKTNPKINMVTPYLHHYFVEALLASGLKEEAFLHIKNYWGGMVKEGADCFYEIYDPQNPLSSPYGTRAKNSYCHAWSSTPCYFIRKYLDK